MVRNTIHLYKYKSVFVISTNKDIDKTLNALGEEGWEIFVLSEVPVKPKGFLNIIKSWFIPIKEEKIKFIIRMRREVELQECTLLNKNK